MIKRTLTAVAAIAAIISISSCGTIKGMGRDIKSLGQSIKGSTNQ